MGWAAAAAGLAPIVGGIIANAQNKKEAQRNRDFQEYMSNTSHQREIKDLKAAGLNPLLSATGGAGASTPSGAQATMENVAQGGVNSALDAARLKLQDTKQREEVKNLKQTNDLTKAQTHKTLTEAMVLRKGIPEAEAKNMLWEKGKKFIESLSTGAKSIMKDPWVSRPQSSYKINKPTQNRNKHGLQDFQKNIIKQKNRR